MKKLLFLSLLIFAVTLVLVSCGENQSDVTTADAATANQIITTAPITTESSAVTAAPVTDAPLYTFKYSENENGEIIIMGIEGFAEEITIPAMIDNKPVTKIGNFAHYGGFTKIIISDGIKKIDGYTFKGLTLLESVEIPESVTEIGGSAFYQCASLKEIKLPSGLKEINDQTFAESGLEKIVIPNGVEYIGSDAFRQTKLKSVTIPSSVKTIGFQAFGGCEEITSVTLCEGIEKIDTGAFAANLKLKTVTIPKSVKEVYSCSFTLCSNLEKIIFEGDAPEEFIYIKSLSGTKWDAEDVSFSIYCNKDAKGFTFPEWNGYPTYVIE